MKVFHAAAAVFFALACASVQTPGATGGSGRRDMVLDAEIQANTSAGTTVYDLVSKIRPEYLRTHGPNTMHDMSAPTAVVYLDNVKFGTVDDMRTISVDRVKQIQYLSSSSATTRFGADQPGGAILLTSR